MHVLIRVIKKISQFITERIKMKYIKSNYTYVLESDKNILVYNSINKNIALITKEKFLSAIQQQKGTLFDHIVDDGFWVTEQRYTQESAIARLNQLNNIFKNELSLTILPTLQCNFRCEYCYEDFKNDFITEECQQNIIKYVRKYIREYTLLKVDWFGGEPLLAIKNIEFLSQNFIRLCKQAKKPYIASITTNGYLLTIDVFKKLLANHVRTFQITLDGLPETHNSKRHLVNGGETFSKILENLRAISHSEEKYFTIIIRTNVTFEIYKNLKKYLQFLFDEFGNDKRFTFLFRPVGDWGGSRVKKIHNELLTGFNNVFETLINSNLNLDHSIYYSLLTNSICEAAKRNSLMIKPDGTIGKCTMHLDHPSNTIGKLNSQDIVWNYSNLYKWISDWNNPLPKCHSCLMLPTCGSSNCPARTIINNQSKLCGYENSALNYILRLLEKNADNYNFIKIYV